MEVYGLEKDLERMFAMNGERMAKIADSEAVIDSSDPIRDLSTALHPPCLKLVITEIRQETEGVKTYRLTTSKRGAMLPYFQAGQYLSLKIKIGNQIVSRPYSISSAPSLAKQFYELTIARKEGGFISEQVWNSWKPGVEISATGPHGNFYYNPLRDQPDLIALAGGCGITPFRSMISEMLKAGEPRKMILIYGSRTEKDILFGDELAEFSRQHPEQLQVIHVLSEPSAQWQGEKGFISSDLLQKVTKDEPLRFSYFLCGPPEMYTYCFKNLSELGIPKRLIRYEPAATADYSLIGTDHPQVDGSVSYAINYRRKTASGKIKALTTETILTAFERAGLNPDAQCRSGECGFCRSLLISGSVYTRRDGDGRRAADLEYGYIHPCSTYPLSDLQLIIS
jgi:glycine betaine catabolism B